MGPCLMCVNTTNLKTRPWHADSPGSTWAWWAAMRLSWTWQSWAPSWTLQSKGRCYSFEIPPEVTSSSAGVCPVLSVQNTMVFVMWLMNVDGIFRTSNIDESFLTESSMSAFCAGDLENSGLGQLYFSRRGSTSPRFLTWFCHLA